MTRAGPSKPVDKLFGRGRRELAKAFLEAAQAEAERAGESGVANPTIALIVNATIAYADALTAEFAGIVNQQDHQTVAAVVREALGNRLPKAQERRLSKLLRERDTAQYGPRVKRMDDGSRLLRELEEFAAWAETALDRSR